MRLNPLMIIFFKIFFIDTPLVLVVNAIYCAMRKLLRKGILEPEYRVRMAGLTSDSELRSTSSRSRILRPSRSPRTAGLMERENANNALAKAEHVCDRLSASSSSCRFIDWYNAIKTV